MPKSYPVFTAIMLALTSTLSLANSLSSSERQVASLHSAAKHSQQQINQVDDATQALRAEYLSNERTADVVEAYNKQMRILIDSQERELADMALQLESIKEVDQAMLPMLNRMVASLRDFVAQDLPFLNSERSKRLAKLDALLTRADVSLAEKYRQILEAYMVEIQYGRTVETYSGRLQQHDSSRQVNFLRLGRTAFYYQTLEGHESGLWQPAQEEWEVLDEGHNQAIFKAIQIAAQRQVPSLMDLPLPALGANL